MKESTNMENKVDIYIKDGKYMVDATIHTEIETNDIAKVQEHFNSDCAYHFAEAIKQHINYGHSVLKYLNKPLEYGDYKFFS